MQMIYVKKIDSKQNSDSNFNDHFFVSLGNNEDVMIVDAWSSKRLPVKEYETYLENMFQCKITDLRKQVILNLPSRASKESVAPLHKKDEDFGITRQEVERYVDHLYNACIPAPKKDLNKGLNSTNLTQKDKTPVAGQEAAVPAIIFSMPGAQEHPKKAKKKKKKKNKV